MGRKNHKTVTRYDAKTLEYMSARTRSNLVWQSLHELKGLIDGTITNLREVKSVSSGQRRSLREEGIIRCDWGTGPRTRRLVVTELGKALMEQESNAE